MIRVTFFMEQHVGHKTYYKNLREYIDADTRISASWVKVTYEADGSSWINRIPFPPSHLKGTLIGRFQTRKGLRKHTSDAIFFFTQVPAMFGGTLLNKVPYVLSTDLTPAQYDDMAEHYDHKPDKPGLVSKYKRHVNTKVFKQAAHILPWTQWTRNSFIDDYGVPVSNLSIVPIGVDINLWCPIQENNRQGPVRILFVGGDFYRKGGRLLLRAFRQLPPGAAELHIVTRMAIKPQENVTVHNHLQPNSPELISLFQSCDIFVLPTKADAFGIVAVEASAAGLPVLMTDVGGVRDIVVDGETGFLLPPDDVDVLTERLRYLVAHADVRRRMSIAARAQAVAKFDASKNGKKVADILLEVAAAI